MGGVRPLSMSVQVSWEIPETCSKFCVVLYDPTLSILVFFIFLFDSAFFVCERGTQIGL